MLTAWLFRLTVGMLASADETGAIKLWDLSNGQIKETLSTGGKVTALRFAPGDRILASATEDGSVSLWDLQTGALSLQLKKAFGRRECDRFFTRWKFDGHRRR